MRLRVLVLGGTGFIGRSIADELAACGHDVVVVHRGGTELEGPADVSHVHGDRMALDALRGDLDRFDAEAVIDCVAMGAADAEAVLAALPPDPAVRLVVLSSMDVYRAYAAVHAGTITDDVPLDETSPVRPNRHPYRGRIPGMDDYEKLEVEERWLARGATVCRLGMVYGEHDAQRRQEFVLRRVRAGRDRIPVGAGTALFTHVYVGDVATGVRLAVEAPAGGAEIFNLGERQSAPVGLTARRILAAAGAAARVELVRVPDDALPPDLRITRAVAQPLLADSGKARRLLGWHDSDPVAALRRTVEWHLSNPPPGPAGAGGDTFGDDFAADDQALALAVNAEATT